LYDLAVFYETGECGEQDLASAFRSYLRAALRGEKQSVYEVGRCYYYGIGIDPDPALADVWLQRAGELGITNAERGPE
jgi:uncharacterized protein